MKPAKYIVIQGLQFRTYTGTVATTGLKVTYSGKEVVL